MRVLLVSSVYGGEYADRAIAAFLRFGSEVVVNTSGWTKTEKEALQNRYDNNTPVSFVCFDADAPDLLSNAIVADGVGFDVLVCPPDVRGLTEDVLISVGRNKTEHRLQAIGVPNDSIGHLNAIKPLIEECGIAIINTPDVHAQSVAEYTLFQIGYHFRRIDYFYEETGRNGSWPHISAISTTHLLRGRTLGVIGGSGKDGAAVIRLAMKLGLEVIAIGSGSMQGMVQICGLGAGIASSIDELISCADFISINCRSSEAAPALIGEKQIALMKPGVIIVNPSNAEILDKQAILHHFRKPEQERRIGALVLDMPYGRRRDSTAFVADDANAELKRHGVRFTPRMAGYTAEEQARAAATLAERLHRYSQANAGTAPAAKQEIEPLGEDGGKSGVLLRLLSDVIVLARRAGSEAIRLRENGLTLLYKADGSPTTNADLAVETEIRDGLRAQGYHLSFSGEELTDRPDYLHDYEVITDGIDGTRNFRDGNYGWCVSVAVREKGESVIGVVYDAHSRETYFAVKDGGCFLANDEGVRRCTLKAGLPEDFSFSVGSFRAREGTAIKRQIIDDIKKLGGRGREWGSVALSICAVVRGGLGVSIQTASHLYDHAAAVLIAQESGADVSQYPTAKPDIFDVIVSHPTLSRPVHSIFQERVGFAEF